MANNNPQIPFHSILSHPENIPNHPHIPNHINNPPEENILNDVVLNVSSPPTLSKEQIDKILKNSDLNEMTECPITHMKGNISGKNQNL